MDDVRAGLALRTESESICMSSSCWCGEIEGMLGEAGADMALNGMESESTVVTSSGRRDGME